MNVIELLKKLGMLHAGSESYKGKGQVLGEFYGSDKAESEQSKEASQDGARARGDETRGETGLPRARPGSSHTGRKVFFWLSLVFGLLCILIMFVAAGVTVWSLLTLLAWVGFSYYAGVYAFTEGGRTGTAVGLFLGVVVLSFIFLAIVSPEVETVSSLDTSTQSGLRYERSVWATMMPDNTLQPREDNHYNQGEAAALVLVNVSGFKQGGDGLHRFDMNVTVEDTGGNTVLEKNDILGENGHVRLPEGMAESPYTAISTADLAPGEYKVRLMIYDRVGGGNARVSRQLVVE